MSDSAVPSPESKLKRYLRLFRDPVSGLTHLAGALCGVSGLIYLLQRPTPAGLVPRLALSVYGLSLILLYSASAAYHLVQASEPTRIWLRRLDHSMVSLFIAGSYTPFCAIALHSRTGLIVLAAVWILALVAIAKTFFWLNSPRWVTAGIYLAMGWIVVLAVYPLSQALSGPAMWLLFGGGVIYSLGSLIYACKWPNPYPPHFGFHELWHLFVLGGSICQFASVATLGQGLP